MITSGAGSEAKVILATSHDDKHPAENIIDGSTDSFWMSTGLFPQEFVLSFTSPITVNSIKIHCYNVRKLEIENSTKKDPVDFKSAKVTAMENVNSTLTYNYTHSTTLRLVHKMESSDAHLQEEEIDLGGISATHLRFIVSSAYDHFISVHKVTIDGN